MDSTIFASLIGAAATVSAALITFYATRKSLARQVLAEGTADACRIEPLANREAVFLKAARLIAGAELCVIDTTWGNSEENYTKLELKALGDYLAAKKSVVSAGKVSYKELYTSVSNDLHRTDRIQSERARSEPANNYSAKLLEGIAADFPMIDFLVVDRRKVILSCLSKDTAKPEHFYLYAETPNLAEFVTQYFQICWDSATPLLEDGNLPLVEARNAA